MVWCGYDGCRCSLPSLESVSMTTEIFVANFFYNLLGLTFQSEKAWPRYKAYNSICGDEERERGHPDLPTLPPPPFSWSHCVQSKFNYKIRFGILSPLFVFAGSPRKKIVEVLQRIFLSQTRILYKVFKSNSILLFLNFLLKVPSHQFRSAWKWYAWIGLHMYMNRGW